MTRLLTLDDLDMDNLEGVPVLVRVDFNVPIEGTEVIDDTRLVEALPTLKELIEAKARVILASHRGRPKGEPDPALSLEPVADHLSELLGAPVRFAHDVVGATAQAAAREIEPGAVCLLENLRFHPGEKAGDAEFAGALARMADVYVGDAFGTAHRAHASVVGAPKLIGRRAAGRLMEKEVKALSLLLARPEKPFMAILGGAKISGKIDTLKNLLPRLDVLMVGGGMANTFLAAQGRDMGRSLVEEDALETAREILAAADRQSTRVLLPSDLVVTDDLENPTRVETVSAGAVPAGMLAVDVGPSTREAFAAEAMRAGTLFWNGPLGVFEKEPFDAGTRHVAQALASASGFTVVGGGETVAAVRQAGVAGDVGHVSTGGGASLDFLAGKTLPGIEVLESS